MNRLANNGDIQTIQEIGESLNQETKKLVSFDNRVCHANLVSGNIPQYLDELEEGIDKATPENLPMLAEQFPRGGAVGILENHPEYVERCRFTHVNVNVI